MLPINILQAKQFMRRKFVTHMINRCFSPRDEVLIYTLEYDKFFLLLIQLPLSDVNVYVEDACLGNHYNSMNNVHSSIYSLCLFALKTTQHCSL